MDYFSHTSDTCFQPHFVNATYAKHEKHQQGTAHRRRHRHNHTRPRALLPTPPARVLTRSPAQSFAAALRRSRKHLVCAPLATTCVASRASTIWPSRNASFLPCFTTRPAQRQQGVHFSAERSMKGASWSCTFALRHVHATVHVARTNSWCLACVC